MHFSDEEATVLLLALRHLGDSETSPLGAAHRTAEQKLRAAIPPGVLAATDQRMRQLFVLPPDHMPGADVVRALREAAKRDDWLLIGYRSLHGDSTRTILPREVYVAGDRWYTNALDTKSSGRRIFRLDRISGAERTTPPAAAHDILARDREPKPDYADAAHPEIVIQLSERGCRLARDLPDLTRFVPRTPEDGFIARFRCPPGELPYYARLLMRLGTEVTVIAPDQMRRLIVAAAEALVSHHDLHGL